VLFVSWFPFFLATVVLSPAGARAAGEVPLSAQDTVVVSSDDAELHFPGKVKVKLPAGQLLRVLDIRAPWVGVSLTWAGEKRKGWILRSKIRPLLPEDRKYKLNVRVRFRGDDISSITPVAMIASETPELSADHTAAQEAAVLRMLDFGKSNEEAIRVLFARRPERVMAKGRTAFSEAGVEIRQTLSRLAVNAPGPDGDSILVQALMDEIVKVRNTATSALRAKDRPLPAGKLLAACRGAKPSQIVNAVKLVNECDDPQVVSALRDFAAHEESSVRVAAVEALSRLGADHVVETVRAAVGDPSFDVRTAALKALQRREQLTDDDLLTALSGAEGKLDSTVLSLVRKTANATLRQLVVDALAAEEEDRRRQAAEALGRMGYAASETSLVKLLQKDPSEQVRTAAATALGKLGALTDFEPLVKAAKEDEKSGVKRAAARALFAAGPSGIEEAFAGLTPADKTAWEAFVVAVGAGDAPDTELLGRVVKLSEDSFRKWENLATASAKLPPQDKYPLMEEILARADGEAQAKVIEQLKEDGSAEALEVLYAACSFPGVLPNKEIGWETSITPTGGGGAWIGTSSKHGDVWRLLIDALSSSPQYNASRASSALLKTALVSCEDSRPGVRAGALRVIAEFGTEDHNDILLRGATDDHKDVREAAAESAGRLPPEKCRAVLEQLVDDSENPVPYHAAQTAASIGGTQLRPLVLTLLKDSRSHVRRPAATGVAKYPDDVDAFLAAVQDVTSHESQADLIEAFAELPLTQAVTAMRELVSRAEDDDFAIKAIEAIQELVSCRKLSVAQAENALGDALESDDAVRRLAAACVLAGFGSPKARPVLMAMRNDDKRLRRCILRCGLAPTRLGEQLLSPARVQLAALLAFQSGYKSEVVYSTTYYYNAPILVRRDVEKFQPGDRWPLDKSEVARSLDVTLIALAAYDDPQSEAEIRKAASSENATTRKSALWALALRDDRLAVEAFLDDPNREVADAAATALGMLGHRASIPALRRHVDDSLPAATAIVEITVH
jgi:HEAT repeat protein